MSETLVALQPLGRSGQMVPRIALGCGNFGGVGSTPELFGEGLSEQEAFELMDAAWELGITCFDTADAYGGGRSESSIGRWIQSRGVRPQITTKTFNPMQLGAGGGLRPERIARQLHMSLERLGVDKIDLYLAHAFDTDVPLSDSLGAFDQAQADGRISAYGVSNFNASQLTASLATGRPQAIQNGYSLLTRQDEEEILPLCAKSHVAYLVFSPLAGGWLAGQYRRGEPYPAGSRMCQIPGPFLHLNTHRTFDVLDRLQKISSSLEISMPGLALAWLLADNRVTQVAIGPDRPEHLQIVGEALEHPLTKEEWSAVERVCR